MTYGNSFRNNRPNFGFSLVVAPTLFLVFTVLAYSADGVHQDSAQYNDSAQFPCQQSLNSKLSNYSMVLSTKDALLSSNQGDYYIVLICGEVPGQCSLIREWSCGNNPQSGFYNCSKLTLISVTKGGNCFLIPPNTYSVVGNDIINSNEELITDVESYAFTYELITYNIPDYFRNLSLCHSDICLDNEGSIVPFGRYFLTEYPSNCPCQDFSCCQDNLKRSIANFTNVTYSKCSQNTTGFICSTNDTCTAYRIDTTPVVGNCSSYYPYSTYVIVCNSGGCISLTSISTDPGILPDFAFWILFGISIFIFMVAFYAGIKFLCSNRPQTM